MTQYVEEKVEKLEHPITIWALSAIIVIMALAYIGFINATITNIVAVRDMQTKISSLYTSVSDLESVYLGEKSKVTMESALADGFVTSSKEIVYVSRTGNSLSFNR